MGDSVQVLNNSYIKRLHSGRPSGKLHKGHNVTAATSSIPSKYQTIVIDNSDRKGFLAKTRRFNYDGAGTENPGPGSYVGHHSIEKASTSFSKKGTGGFASKDRRIHRPDLTSGPGSGSYALPSMLVTTKDFNRGGATSNFHRPIAVAGPDRKPALPAPNSYDVHKGGIMTGKANNVSANAAFKSQSKRDAINVSDTQRKPAPWQYHVKDEVVKPNVQVPLSSFKSKTKRQMQPSPHPVPGPGTYQPHEAVDPVQKTVFPRKHYLCISAPAMPLPTTPPLPGPGSYEVVDYEGPSKHYMSGAAFVSTTSRWNTGDINIGTATTLPGPAHYRPSEVGKQSFIYNATNRWI